MRADGKNTRGWHGVLGALIGASALLSGCATDVRDEGMREGTYAVTGLDLGSCASDAWSKSATTTSSLLVEANGGEYVVKACTESDGLQTCLPTSPSRFVLEGDRWRGLDGGAYLVESGCLLVSVDATASLDANELVIETAHWSANLASGTCTYDEVIAMRGEPCATRTRLYATEK